MTAVTVVSQDSESSLFNAKVSISPTGGYRAAVQKRSDTGLSVFYRSSDGGASWTAIAAPDSTSDLFMVAAADNGDLHVIGRSSSLVISYWKYSGGAWGTIHTVRSSTVNAFTQWLGWDGTNLIAVVAENGGATNIFYSTTGTTWTFGPGLAANNASVPTLRGLFLGGYVHFTLNDLGTLEYRRYNVSTHAVTSPSVSLQTNPTNWETPVPLARHGSTSEIWLAQMATAGTTVYLFKSTDSGATWSTVASAEAIPAALGAPAGQGVSMGSDDKLHFWGHGDGTTVLEMARDLAGTWDAAASSVAVAGYQMLAAVSGRNDGTQPNVAEIWGQLRQASGSATPTVLVFISGVTPPSGGWSVGSIRIG